MPLSKFFVSTQKLFGIQCIIVKLCTNIKHGHLMCLYFYRVMPLCNIQFENQGHCVNYKLLKVFSKKLKINSKYNVTSGWGPMTLNAIYISIKVGPC